MLSGCLRKRREHILPGSDSGLQMASAVEHFKGQSYTLSISGWALCDLRLLLPDPEKPCSRNLGYRDIFCLSS